MYTSIFIEAVQNVTCELKMQCSQINIPLYEFCHSCLCFSVFGDFKLCVFQPVFERACLQLCSLILFVRSAYIQGYDFI